MIGHRLFLVSWSLQDPKAIRLFGSGLEVPNLAPCGVSALLPIIARSRLRIVDADQVVQRRVGLFFRQQR
jgi:hypothetical protein